MRFTSLTQVLESSSVRARSLLLGFSMLYSTRSQSSNVRWVCCWQDVTSIRCRTKWSQAVGRPVSLLIGPTYALARLREQFPLMIAAPYRYVVLVLYEDPLSLDRGFGRDVGSNLRFGHPQRHH